MNKKGFTLIELLAVIVLIAIVGIIAIPSIIDYIKSSKEASYKILQTDIYIAAQTYYEECEYGDLSNGAKYGIDACNISDNPKEVSLSTLANLGILSASDVDNETGKTVIDPRNDEDISNCIIKIKKETITDQESDENGIKNTKVKYTVTPKSGCPQGMKITNDISGK